MSEKPSELPATKAHPVVGQLPPPPPGPPPPQSYQDHQQSSPAKDEKKQHLAQEERFDSDGREQQQQRLPQLPPPLEQAQQQPLGENSMEFPPPPPPQRQPQAEQQYHEHDHDHEQRQHQQQAYSIPAYDPANPVFAPSLMRTDHHQDTRMDDDRESSQDSQEHHSAAHHAQSSSHDRPKHSWSERFSQFGIKAAAPINNIAHKLGSQSFLPETLDKECDKAAAILRAFCKKGVYAEPGEFENSNETRPNADIKGDKAEAVARGESKNRVIVTIPPRVIAKAVGLAIFTTLRAGYGLSGATGSGILVARLPDRSWSPPSGIQLHTVGGGFQIGLDIYDCVCVINSEKALEAFMATRVSLGSDLAVVAGPYGAGGAVNFGAAIPDQKASKKARNAKPSDGEVSTGKEKLSSPPQQQQQQQQQNPSYDGQVDKKKEGGRCVPPSATKPVFSYVKSRGLFAGISVDGTVVSECKDANASFYGQTIGVRQILRGQVPAQGPAGMWPVAAQNLLAILQGAEAGVQQQKQQQHHYQQSPELQVPSNSYDRNIVKDEAPPPEYVDVGRHPVDPDVKYK